MIAQQDRAEAVARAKDDKTTPLAILTRRARATARRATEASFKRYITEPIARPNSYCTLDIKTSDDKTLASWSGVIQGISKCEPAPIPMRLPCEGCGELHVDEGEFATRPHHTHACQHCGMVWRPAIAHTVGVRFLPGFKSASPA